MGVLHNTAKAVRDLLNAASLSKAFTASLEYDTELSLEDLDTLEVTVVPAGLSQQQSTRGSIDYTVSVDVAVRYRFGVVDQLSATQEIDTDTIAEYGGLLEEILEYIADPDNRVLGTTPKASLQSNEIRIPWVPAHMHENRQYTGIVRASYYVNKAL